MFKFIQGLLVFTLLATSLVVGAEETSKATKTEKSSESSTDESRFGSWFSIHNGYGTMGIGALAANRTMNPTTILAMPGWRFGKWMPGLPLEYQMTAQTTEPTAVSSTNLRGSGYLVGIGTNYDLDDKWQFMFHFDFFGRYTLGNSTPTGDTSYYSKPLGFRIGAGYLIKDEWAHMRANFLTSYHTFKTNTNAGVDTDLGSNGLTDLSFNLGISVEI